MSREFFVQVTDALGGMLAPEPRAQWQWHGAGLKVWFGDRREHYEAQFVPRGRTVGLEVGFHAEHPDVARNDEVLARLTAGERRWRRALGADPEAGPFLGRQRDRWRRLSEVWDTPDLRGPDGPVEVADRLATFIRALEPVRRG